MRALPVIALALLLAGAATASTPHRIAGPFTIGSFSELSGSVALGGSGGAQRLRFLPDRRFSVGALLQNTSRRPVVLTGAKVLEPRHTLIHQTGARFHPWSPPSCPPGASCPARVFSIGTGAAHHPRPRTIKPGEYVGVELDFRLGSCADVPGASPAPISRLRVTFRGTSGSREDRVLALGSDALRLRMPKPEDCVSPRSTLFVNDPSHIGTSYLFTIPGSQGDVCARTGHKLVFRSRAMKNNDSLPERVVIRLSPFAGPAPYDGATVAVVVGRKTRFHTRALLEVTKSNGREVFAKVHAHRIQGWMRCRISG